MEKQSGELLLLDADVWFRSDRVLGQLLMASGTMMENPFIQVAQVLRQNTPLVRPLPRVVFSYS